jgi:hypothetical protein
MTHHDKVSDKEISKEEMAKVVEQPNSGVAELPALQDSASVPASEDKLKTKKGDGKKGGKPQKGSSGGYTGLNKYRADMNCSSCGRSMVQTGSITTEDLTVTKKIPMRGDGKPAYKPMAGVGANKALAVVCDDCVRQNKSPEEGGTNMPITYKTVVVMTNEGKVINIPISYLK